MYGLITGFSAFLVADQYDTAQNTAIRALEYPFDNIVQVEPEAFQMFLGKIEASGGR